MQPFNYTIDAPNPTQAFMQSFQAGNAMVQAQAARQQQEAQKQQALRLQNALSGLGPNATPAEFMGLVQQFPDLAEPLTKQYRTFDDARKNGLFSAGERAFMLLRPSADGTLAVDEAVASLEESATAFENSGQPDIAKQLRDSAKAARINPAAARTALGTMLAFADPEKFKKVGDAIGQPGDTPFIKELIAEGLKPGSPEFVEALKAKRQDSPFVVVPGVGVFAKKDVLAAAEGGSVAPAIPQEAVDFLKANPKLRGVFDAKYGAGAAARVLGGQ